MRRAIRAILVAIVVAVSSPAAAVAADVVAVASGNWTDASTWGVADTTSKNVSTSTSSTALTTGNLDSSVFQPGAIEVRGFLVRIASRASGTPTNTLTLSLYNSTGAAVVQSCVIEVADLPATDTSKDQGGWLFCRFATPETLIAATDYRIRATLSATSTAVSLNTNGTASNWQRLLVTSTEAAPAAGDDIHIAGWFSNATTPADLSPVVVTMNSTTATDYGSATTNVRVPALVISNGGTLSYGIAAATDYVLRISGNIVVYSGGTLAQGAPGAAVPRSSTAVLEMDEGSDLQFVISIRDGGTRRLEGESRLAGSTNVWALLNADAAIAATTLATDRQLSAVSGDEIAISGTTTNRSQDEVRVLDGDAGASDLTVTVGLAVAHNGDDNRQATIVVLTRNVIVRSVSTTFMMYEDWAPGSIASARWAQWRYGGQGGTWGALNFRNTDGIAEYCVWRESDGYGVHAQATSTGAQIRHGVDYDNTGSVSAGATLLFGQGMVIDDFVSMGVSGSNSYGVHVRDVAGLEQFTNIRASGGSSCGISIGFALTNGNGLTIQNLVAHSNSGSGLCAQVITSDVTIDNVDAWSNASGGVLLLGTAGLLITDLWSVGNSIGVWVQNDNDVSIRDGIIASNSPGDGIQLQGNNDGGTFVRLAVENVAFGTTAGAGYSQNWLGQHDLGWTNGTQNTNYFEIDFINSTFDQALTGIASASLGSFRSYTSKVSVQLSDGSARMAVVGAGVVESEATVCEGDPPCLKVSPTSARLRLSTSGNRKGRGFSVPVASGSAVTVSVSVRTTADYNGDPPRLIAKASPHVGIADDVVLDSHTAAADVWENLQGTTAAATADGAMEFVVDGNGTAGSFYVDTINVGRGENRLTWYNGAPTYVDLQEGSGGAGGGQSIIVVP